MSKVIAGTLIALTLPVATATAAPRATTSDCGIVRAGGSAYVFFHQGVSCRFGKKWVRRLVRSGGDSKPKGFRCTSGSGFTTGGQCEKKSDAHVVFGWHPGD
jgi:hypothetical protein